MELRTKQNDLIYYELHGAGAIPLLFIPGWNGCMSSFKNRLGVDFPFPLLLVDLPGCGKSAPTSVSMDSICDSLSQLLQHLSIEKVHIAGFCLGGIFAIEFAFRNPQRVDQLLLIEMQFHFPIILIPFLFPSINQKILAFMLTTKVGKRFIETLFMQEQSQYRESFYEEFKQRCGATAVEYIRIAWDYSRINHRPQMKSLQVPVTIINGENRRSFMSKRRSKKAIPFPHCRYVNIENAGHFPIEENPAALVEAIISTISNRKL